MQRVAVVANPTKIDDVPAVRDALADLAAQHDAELLFYQTTEADPGTGQTRQALADGADLVFALGGDGTVRAVAEQLLETEVELGLLPGGTGNLLARNLGTPVNTVADAFVAAMEGAERVIDVGWVSLDGGQEELFLVMAGMGLDAQTMADTTEQTKARLGWIAYGLTGLGKVTGKGLHVQLGDGGRPWRQHARSVMVGNCGAVQGGVVLMPDAELDDGRLDLLVFAPRGLFGWTAALWQIVTRSRRGHPSVLQRSAERFELLSKRPALAQIDGDAVGELRRMDFRVQPAALRVRVLTGPTH